MSERDARRLLELLDARDAALQAHGGDYNNPVVWKAQHEYRMAREHFRVVDMSRAYLGALDALKKVEARATHLDAFTAECVRAAIRKAQGAE